MNNNRNNRRRGRGNRNQGGGNQSNRIDSRARGNAPQLLDKYKKLAQDAQHNGDRVQMEYYLQFADHYFRVLADNRARQDEQRSRRDDRDGDGNESDDDDDGEDRRRSSNRRSRPRYDDQDSDRGHEGAQTEAGDNPFARDEDEDKPRKRSPRPRRETAAARSAQGSGRAARSEDDSADDHGIDAAALPPSIGANDREDEEKPVRRRRKRSEDEGPLSAVG